MQRSKQNSINRIKKTHSSRTAVNKVQTLCSPGRAHPFFHLETGYSHPSRREDTLKEDNCAPMPSYQSGKTVTETALGTG